MSGKTPTLVPPVTDAPAPPRAGTAPAVKRTREILIATVNRPIGQTGVHTHTRALRDGLAAAGFKCSVESPFSRGPHWLPIFAIRRIFGALSKSWSTRWYRRWHRAALRDNLLKRLREAPFNGVILAQCPLSADAALEARHEIGLSQPVAMVCHFNFSEAREYREKGELSDEASFQEILDFEKRVLGSVDRVIYVSKWARQVVEQTRGIRTAASSVIWNGVPPDVSPAASRSAIELADNDLVLMNVGTLEPRKNQLGLIDLFERIAPQEPRARLVLVGEGPARAGIEQEIADKGLCQRVTLLGHRRDVAALLGAADLYIHYASLENCPVVLLEAARAGLPVAALPGGGSAELLESLGGVSLDAENLDRSLDSLRPLLSDARQRREMGERARKSFERSFTQAAMVDAYLRELGLHGAEGQ